MCIAYPSAYNPNTSYNLSYYIVGGGPLPFDIAGWSLGYLGAAYYTMPFVPQHIDDTQHKGDHKVSLVLAMALMKIYLAMEVYMQMRMALILHL